MTVYTMLNSKGGVGRSTSAMQLLVGLARRPKKDGKPRQVCLLDIDPQHNSVDMADKTAFNENGLHRKAPATLMRAIADKDLTECLVHLTKNISVFESGTDLWQLPRYLEHLYPKESDYPLRVEYLPSLMKPMFEQFDDVVIDTMPTEGILDLSAVLMSQVILIVTQCQTDSLKGSEQCFSYVQETYKNYRDFCDLRKILVLPTMYQKRNSRDREVLAQMRRLYGEAVLPPVPYMARLKRYSGDGLPALPGTFKAKYTADWFDKQVIRVYKNVIDELIKKEAE